MKGGVFWVFLCAVCSIFGQREAANWYFGINAGLTFTNGAPQPLLDGQLRAVEGSSVISDPDGNLLFYTDGQNVWNRNHTIMRNGIGLMGSPSSTQGALIVPNPEFPLLHYIFTTDDILLAQNNQSNGFNYSVVNTDLEQGFGEVIIKNRELLPASSEKVSVVFNFLGNYYWVLTHFEDRFYAYRVDRNGVTETPVVSVVGPNIQNPENGRGTLKLSPDGTKVAMSYLIREPAFATNLFAFDFDITTGVVSNPVEASNDNRAYYGVEFSSRSNKLYASGVRFSGNTTLGRAEIVQFDLEQNGFLDQGTVILDFSVNAATFVAGALQIGIDKRIYHSLSNSLLSIIREPNEEAQFVDAQSFVIGLGGREATFGLPPFIQSFFESIATIENPCFGEPTMFTPDNLANITSISWDFGDPNSGATNTFMGLDAQHVFSAPGEYTITAEVTYTSGVIRRLLEVVTIEEIPNVLEEAVLEQCDVDGMDDGLTTFNLLDAIPLFANGNTDFDVDFFGTIAEAEANENPLEPVGYANTVPGEMVYARIFTNRNCFALVEITLETIPLSNLGMFDTFFSCDGTLNGNTLTANLTSVLNELRVNFPDGDILFFRTNQDALLNRNTVPIGPFSFNRNDIPEFVFRVFENNQCAFIGSFEWVVQASPDFAPLVSLELCNGQALLTALPDFDAYVWSTGEATQEIMVNGTGNFTVTFANGPCTFTQTFEVSDTPPIAIEEILVEDFTQNPSITVLIGTTEDSENLQFSIDGGRTFQAENTFLNVTPNIYDLVVTNGCTVFEDQLLVGGVPNFFTPNGDRNNDVFLLENAGFFPGYQINIFDRYGKLLVTVTDGNPIWDGSYQNNDLPSSNYWYNLSLPDGRSVQGSFVLKR